MNDENKKNTTPKAGYEKEGVNVKKVFILIILGVVVIAVSLVILNEYFFYSKEQVVYEEVLKPESITLKELRAREDSILTSYGYSDSTKTTFRIPLEKAIELTLEDVKKAKK